LTTQPKTRCREIRDDDIGAVIELLAKGFPERGRDHWVRGLHRLRSRADAQTTPKYGYLLESDDGPVGAILMLFVSLDLGDEVVKRCNLSSWYADSAFRSHAPLLSSQATKDKSYTYVNISPATHTWPIIEAHGFRCYSNGQFLAVAALSATEAGVRVIEVQASAGGNPMEDPTSLPERKLLLDHAGYGCTCVVCRAADGDHPFVFVPIGLEKGPLELPGAQLVYCRSIGEFVRFAGILGRFLLRRGMLFVSIDSNGPVGGLIGVYRASRGRKYYKGPRPPRLGDLAYTEIVIFGP
jgi:hypothetical protein